MRHSPGFDEILYEVATPEAVFVSFMVLEKFDLRENRIFSAVRHMMAGIEKYTSALKILNLIRPGWC